MTELKPCPFSIHKNQKLAIHHRGSRWYKDGLFAVKCNICGIRGPYALSERHAIERWNTRAERMCEVVKGKCSNCGKDLPEDPYSDYEGNYCPNCGAKVVGE